MLKNRAEKAEQTYFMGCNCAQAVLCACCEDFGLSFAAAYKLAEAFGGGVGATHQNLCGALAGAVMAAGLALSDGEFGQKTKDRTNAAVQEILRRFEAAEGTRICEEILARETDPDPDAPKKKVCIQAVRNAAQILYDVLLAQENVK